MIFDPSNREAMERIRREQAEYVERNSRKEAERIMREWQRKQAKQNAE